MSKILKESLPFEMCIPNQKAENEIDWFNKHCVVAESISDGLRKIDEQRKEFYCYNCEEELDADDLVWYNDTPVCPNCEERIEE